jgi:hypothetical protein
MPRRPPRDPDDPDERRRASKRAWYERSCAGLMMPKGVIAGRDELDLLIGQKKLRADEAHDAKAVGRAITEFLRDIAQHPEKLDTSKSPC